MEREIVSMRRWIEDNKRDDLEEQRRREREAKRGRSQNRRSSKPGRASNYIKSIDSIHSGDLVILACRVSGYEQNRSGNLRDQAARMKSDLEGRGATVIDVAKRVGPGHDPSWLKEAAKTARRREAKLVAETTSRFICRSRNLV